jgi:putative Ca2+/H+ antiporter (TMEM165/GDT1 family)
MEALLVSTSVVALAEMGDKTQLATVALAARYEPLVAIVMGRRSA